MNDRIEFSSKDVMITCPESRKSSNPKPQLRWEVDGKPLPTDKRFNVDKRTLKIVGLKKEDTNNYTCITENIAGVKSETMHLQVYGMPFMRFLPSMFLP